ncbi:HD family phosphohydrolase [Fusibacter bizertensis]|uniref:HD family phosphohydrolase n=1 Tax=Fusibacter bizertensis TaxID=1488331 RepID=A0ABT6NAQ3_9FIRM|nr:HD family phosphohydrolase [Fusibacter bizertensis]MDH8677492.1 HD family phosphohydrolase [Fusibacter bizertensis]
MFKKNQGQEILSIHWDRLNEYIDLTHEILVHSKVKSMSSFIQHGTTNCYDHSLYVSYISYRVCKRLRLDYKSAARGALLHDFFLYDWHIPGNSEGLHGFSHPKKAHDNALKFFKLNNLEREIILKHMWPLTLAVPTKLEVFVVVFVDKYCSIMETIRLNNKTRLSHLQKLSYEIT